MCFIFGLSIVITLNGVDIWRGNSKSKEAAGGYLFISGGIRCVISTFCETKEATTVPNGRTVQHLPRFRAPFWQSV